MGLVHQEASNKTTEPNQSHAKHPSTWEHIVLADHEQEGVVEDYDHEHVAQDVEETRGLSLLKVLHIEDMLGPLAGGLGEVRRSNFCGGAVGWFSWDVRRGGVWACIFSPLGKEAPPILDILIGLGVLVTVVPVFDLEMGHLGRLRSAVFLFPLRYPHLGRRFATGKRGW